MFHSMYTWNAVVSSNAEKLGFTFCPMLWGTKNLADFRNKRTKYGKCMIGMNEYVFSFLFLFPFPSSASPSFVEGLC